MFASPKHWYVQTDFGTLLGPMPDDALAEMARTGALLGQDQVREGTDGVWSFASDVRGLFGNGASSSFGSPAVTPDEPLLREMPDGSFVMSSIAERPLVDRPDAPRELSPPSMSEASIPDAATSVSCFDELLDLQRDRPTQRLAKTKAESADEESDELDFELDGPLIAPRVISDPPPIAEHAATSSQELIPAVDPVSLSRPVISVECEPPSFSVQAWNAPSVPAIRRPFAKAAFQPRPNRWTQRWSAVSIAAAMTLMLVATATWWFWPRQRFDIYTNYVAIYKEWQQRREPTQDQTGWSEFVNLAKAQLNESVPWLEKTAVPGQREKSLLLYVGRDLQKILDQPHGSESPHQERLNYFVDQLQEMYVPPK